MMRELRTIRLVMSEGRVDDYRMRFQVLCDENMNLKRPEAKVYHMQDQTKLVQ